MIHRIAIFFSTIFLGGPLVGKPVDGRWNGKAWEFEELKKKVKQGEADALAEWAYCMRENWFDLHGSPKEIFSIASRASEKGSSLGDALLSRMYLIGRGVEKDEAKARHYAEKSHRAKHPLGTSNYAGLYLRGAGGLEEDNETTYFLAKEAADGGCVVAKYNLAIFQNYGDVYLKKDTRAALQKMSELVLRHEHDISAAFILKNHYYLRRYRGGDPSEKVLARCLKIINRKIRACQDSESLCLLACYHLAKGDKETGIPLLLKSYKSPNPSKLSRQVAYYLTKGYRMGQREPVVGGESYTMQEIALSGIELGLKDENMYYSAGSSYLHVLNEKPRDFAKGIELLLKSHQLGKDWALTKVGGLMIDPKTPKDFQNPALGVAVLTYNAKEDEWARGELADYLCQKETPHFDPVRAYAFNVHLYEEKLLPPRSTARFQKQAKALKEILTEEEIKKAKDMIREKFYADDGTRLEALKVMKTHPYFKDMK